MLCAIWINQNLIGCNTATNGVFNFMMMRLAPLVRSPVIASSRLIDDGLTISSRFPSPLNEFMNFRSSHFLRPIVRFNRRFEVFRKILLTLIGPVSAKLPSLGICLQTRIGLADGFGVLGM